MFLNLTVDMCIALVLTLILGTPLLSLIGAIAVGLTVGLPGKRWSAVGTAIIPSLFRY